MMFELVLSLILLVPGILLLLFRGELGFGLTTLQRPAYSMFYQDVWEKSNILLGMILSVGGIVSFLVGGMYSVEYEVSFIVSCAFISIIVVSEYSYRVFLSKVFSDPELENETLEVIKGLSRPVAVVVLSFSLISIISGLLTLPYLYRVGLYSVITIQVSLIIIVIYIVFNTVKRPPFLAYPWLPEKWVTWLLIIVSISSDILLTVSSLSIITAI